MKYLLLSLLYLSAIVCRGQVVATILNEIAEPQISATALVLSSQDSTMIGFGLTDEKGKVKIYDIPSGSYLLNVSYTGYEDLMIAFQSEKSNQLVDLGTSRMEVNTQVIEEVEVMAEHIPMGMRGDTITYNTAAFQTPPGASVEELLKKLPGIEVGRDGSIKAQGEDVKNVLVDGKEFFNGSPTMATKNLEAEAVDKIQVFDKQSEEAEFTGIDDGQEKKTLNLKLKEDYKNGGFGNINAEGATDQRYLAKASYNRFSPSTQASILGSINNQNEQVFSFNDYLNMMGGFDNLLSSGGLNIGNMLGRNGGDIGELRQYAVGSNLNHDFNDELDLNSNYLYSGGSQDQIVEQLSESFGSSTFTRQDTTRSLGTNHRHLLNTRLKYKPTPFFQASWRNNLSYGRNDLDQQSQSAFSSEDITINESINEFNQATSSMGILSKLSLQKKFKNKTNWITNLGLKYDLNNENAEINNFISSPLAQILQEQLFDNSYLETDLSTKYTFPFFKKILTTVRYRYYRYTQDPTRSYFDLDEGSKSLNTALSNTFNNDWSHHTAGISWRKNKKGLKINGGLSFQAAQLNAQDDQGTAINNDFINVLPFFEIRKRYSSSLNLNLNYSTNVSPPSLTQLITQVNNLNAVSTFVGNPNLRPAYSHNLGIDLNYYDQFNLAGIFARADYTYSPNQVVYARSFDENQLATVSPINTNYYHQASVYLSHNAPLRPLGIKYEVSLDARFSRYQSLFNQANINNEDRNITFDLQLENRNKSFIDLAIGWRMDVNAVKNEIISNVSDPFINNSYYCDIVLTLTPKWLIKTKYDLAQFNGLRRNAPTYIHLLNAKIQYQVMDKMNVYLTGFDILNQQRGIRQESSTNLLSLRRFNTVTQYFGVGIQYSLGKVKNTGITLESL